MNRNAFDFRRLMGELDDIKEEGIFNVSRLMAALKSVESNPTMPVEKAKEIVEGVKEEIKVLRRSARQRELAEKKKAQAAAAAAANVNMSSYNRLPNRAKVSRRRYSRSRSANKGRSSGRSRSRSANRRRASRRNRSISRNRRVTMRNNGPKPMSKILTGRAKGKSLYAQAETIKSNPKKIKEERHVDYLKGQYNSFDEFIESYPENAHIGNIRQAKNILLTNPGVYQKVNPASAMMANNNNL